MKDKKGSSIQRFFFNTMWMLFDKVFLLILNLVVTLRIANYYGSQNYGLYQYAVSVVAIFEICVTLIDGRVVKKRYDADNPADLVWNATISRLIIAIVALFLGVIYLIISGEKSEYGLIFVILLINTAVTNLRFGMQNRFEYNLRAKKVVVANNIALTLGGILQLVAVYLDYSISAIAIITVFSSFTCVLIIFFQYKKDYGNFFRGKPNKTIIKELLIESLPLAIAASCATIYGRCDSIMIGKMLSKADVGVYAIAVKLINVVQIPLSPIRESIFPKMIELYHTDKKKYEKRYIQITSLMTWIYIIGVSTSFVILPFLFKYMNPEYANAYPVYKVYVIESFFMYNASLRAGHYTIIRRGNILMYAQIVSVVVNIILNYFLISAMGIYGAAIATGITECMSLWISNLFFGNTGREVFIWQLKGLNPFNVFIA